MAVSPAPAPDPLVASQPVRGVFKSPRRNIALVGLGYWGRNLFRNLSELGVLSVACDRDAALLARRTALSEDVEPSTRYERILQDRTIDGVVIATPAACHYEHARRALLADKDVLVEKPLALNYEEGAKLVTLARERERLLMVGHVLEYHPAIDRLLELISARELGQIRYIYSHRLSMGKIRSEENILWSFAPHDIAIILRIMGNRLPFEVVACGGSYVQPNIADVTVTNLLFDNGVRSHIHVSWLHPFKEHRLVVIGARKMAAFNDVTKTLTVYDQKVEVNDQGAISVCGEGKEIMFDAEEPLRRECQAFVQAIQTRQAPLTDGVSGLRVLKVLQAAQHSLVRNGQSVALPLSFSRVF